MNYYFIYNIRFYAYHTINIKLEFKIWCNAYKQFNCCKHSYSPKFP